MQVKSVQSIFMFINNRSISDKTYILTLQHVGFMQSFVLEI